MAETNSGFYIPSLDGIRTVAFLLVFVSHAGWGHIVPGGFGVTVFFFLSGYLITSLIRREYEKTTRIDLPQFYLRRVLRIFPTMYLTLALSVVLAIAGLLPGEIRAEPVMYQAAFLTNYYKLWGAFPDGMPAGTGVLWSLAVEEHFYMFFPLLSLLMMPRLSPRGQAKLLLVICAVVLAWRCVLVHGLHAGEERTYVASDTHIDSILYGCIVGVFCNPYMDRPLSFSYFGKVALYVLSLGLLMFCFLYRDVAFRETFRYTIQGIALAPLFYLAIVDWKRPWFLWLNWKPVRVLGTMTYGLYLVHFTAIESVKHLWPEGAMLTQALIALAVSLAFASVMYVLIERPLARLRKRLHRDSRPLATNDVRDSARSYSLIIESRVEANNTVCCRFMGASAQ